MLAKRNVPTNSEVGLMVAIVGAAHGDGKEERDSNYGATFHMSYIHAEMTVYEKASSGTTVEVADGTILPVEGFGIIVVDLDHLDNMTKQVNMIAVAYVPEL